jgi:hypothetical protein
MKRNECNIGLKKNKRHKNHMVISDGEKPLIKFNILSQKGTLKKRIEGMYLNIIKAIYDKPL